MSSTVDLSYFGKDENTKMKDQLTPFKIAVLILIDEFVQSTREDGGPIEYFLSQQQERDMMILILQLVQGADTELRELQNKMDEIDCQIVFNKMTERLQDLNNDEVSAIMDILQTIPDDLCREPRPFIQKSSVIGLYIRRMHLTYDKLHFSQVTKLYDRFKTFLETWQNTSHESGYNLYDKPDDMPDDDDDNDTDDERSLIIMNRIKIPPENHREEEIEQDINCEGKYSKQQAELFIAQQSSMLHHNEQVAMPPHKLQQNVMELLSSNPDLAEAHFLAYMNKMRINEYVGAVDSLFHYFDRKLITTAAQVSSTYPPQQLPKERDEEIINFNFRYAALNMASLHYRFGNFSESLSFVQESIRLAQEFNDHICLQHCHGWLQRLGIERGDSAVHVLDRLITKTGELNMPYIMSLGIQAFARHVALLKSPPCHVFEMMIRSDIFNCQHLHLSLVCSSLAQKAALWNMYGKREMCSLNCQILLNLETSVMGMYHNDEAECLALCQLSAIHSNQGMYSMAFQILDSAKFRFPPNTQYAYIWSLQEQITIFRRALGHGKWSNAEHAILQMKAINPQEAKYCRCVLLKEKGEISSAFESVIELIEQCRAKKSDAIQVPEMLARLLIIQAEIYCATSNPTAASQPLLECITLCKQHHFASIRAIATLHLAYVQLCLGLPQHGLELIHSVLVPILAQGNLQDRARAYYLEVKCKVTCAKNIDDPRGIDIEKARLNGSKTMTNVINWFKSVEDHHRTKDAYYYQAKLYNELGYEELRNRSALNFRLLDQQYPTWHKGQVLRF